MDLHLDLYKSLMGEDFPMGIFVLTDGGCKGNNLPATRKAERKMYGSFVVIHNRKVVASTYMLNTALVHRENDLPDPDLVASSPVAECMMTVTAMEYVNQVMDRKRERGDKMPLPEITILQDNEMAVGFASGAKQPDSKNGAMVMRHKAITIHPMRKHLKFKWVHNQWVKAVLGH